MEYLSERQLNKVLKSGLSDMQTLLFTKQDLYELRSLMFTLRRKCQSIEDWEDYQAATTWLWRFVTVLKFMDKKD